MSLLGRLRALLAPDRGLTEAAQRELEQAIGLHEAGRLDDAAARYAALLAKAPGDARLTHLIGLVAHQRGQHREAVERIREAIGRDPNVALFHFNLGNAYIGLGATGLAAESFKRAAALDANHAAAWFNLGEAEYRLAHYAASTDALRHAVPLQPDNAEAAIMLARGLVSAAGAGQAGSEAWSEAAQLLEGRWRHAADPLDARHMLAYALQEQGEVSRAAAHYEGILAESPSSEQAHNNLANCYNLLARRAEAVNHYREVLRLSPGNALAASSIISIMNYDETATPEALSGTHRDWARRFADPLPRPGSYPNARDPDRRLRIGYVSPDLRQHVVACLFAPVLERHDRQAFEPYCYYNYPTSDAVTDRLRRSAAQWRDIHALNDEQAAARVREDRIDILVDLTGHTSYGRLLTFARKPAPLQVSWLGYFSSTGLGQMDAFLSDPHSSPPGQELWFSEQLLRVPHTRFVFEPHAFYPAVNTLPALERGAVTFGCLNTLAKLNARVLQVWSRLLDRLPASRLVLQARALSDAPTRERFLRECEQNGLPLDRIDVQPWKPLQQAFEAYQHIDIALDPFPFCGGMTSFDSLWMGVPVVTLTGPLIASRQTASMLMNLGLNEWIAENGEQYVEIAVRMANSPDRLAALRAGLRARMGKSPLCDYEAFTRDLETAYRKLWRQWLSGSPHPNPPPR